MRIALCYPRTKKDARGLSAMPLGVLILGTILKNKGHEVKVFDSSFDENVNETFERVIKFHPDVVGVSLLTPFYHEGMQLIRLAKSGGYITILGGPHATIEPISSLKENLSIDYVVIGEGESTLPDLLENLKNPSKIKGIAYRSGDKVIVNELRENISEEELNIIPNRELLETLPKYIDSRIINIIVYRGCPFNCAFCQPTLRKLFGNGRRMRSPENVVMELKYLNEKYKPRRFLFSDDTFTANHEWVIKFVDLIKKEKLKIRFDISTRVNKNIINEDILKLLKSAGLYKISFGVESGSQEILNGLNKGTTIEEIERAFSLCRDYKIKTHAFIMFGSIGETKETLKETEELIGRIKPNTINFSIATPQVGTNLYSICSDMGLLEFKDARQSDYYGWEFEFLPIKNKNITFADVLNVRNRIKKKRRINFILDNLEEEIRDISFKRLIYALKEFKKRKDKG